MPAIQALESKQEIPEGDHRIVKTPSARSSSEVPRQEACAFSIELLLFVLAFLRQICIRVCTQILLLPLTCVSQAVVFEPSWPLACIKQLVLFLLLELCCDIIPWVPPGRCISGAGATSWYQSRLPVGHPLPTPWSKLSLVIANYFTNLMCGLRAHVVTGWY